MSELNKTFQNVYVHIIDHPMDPQANELNFQKINLCWIPHAKRNTKISSVDTLLAKELVTDDCRQ